MINRLSGAREDVVGQKLMVQQQRKKSEGRRVRVRERERER